MKLRLDDLKAGIDKLEGKPHIAEVMEMHPRQSEMSELHLQSQKSLAELDELKVSGEVTWEYLKAELDKAFDALAHSLRDFKSGN